MPPDTQHARHARHAQHALLDELAALSEAAVVALEADDAETAGALNARRRRVIERLGPLATDARTRALAARARSLDAELLRVGTSRRDELAARLRRLPAAGRAREGYAATVALDTRGARGARGVPAAPGSRGART